MDMKDQIIDKLDFTEEQYEEVRESDMLPFGDMVDNAIKEFEAIDKDGWKHGDKVEEVAYIINDMWSQISK